VIDEVSQVFLIFISQTRQIQTFTYRSPDVFCTVRSSDILLSQQQCPSPDGNHLALVDRGSGKHPFAVDGRGPYLNAWVYPIG